jgi:predicted DNA-binding protein
MNRSSYNFTDAFKERLEALSKEIGKTQTAVIVDAVNAYASGTLPDKKIIDLLTQLMADNAELKKSVEDNRTLLMAVLKELQKA